MTNARILFLLYQMLAIMLLGVCRTPGCPAACSLRIMLQHPGHWDPLLRKIGMVLTFFARIAFPESNLEVIGLRVGDEQAGLALA